MQTGLSLGGQIIVLVCLVFVFGLAVVLTPRFWGLNRARREGSAGVKAGAGAAPGDHTKS